MAHDAGNGGACPLPPPIQTVGVMYESHDDDQHFIKWFPNTEDAWNWIVQRVLLHNQDNPTWTVATLAQTNYELSRRRWFTVADDNLDTQYRYIIHTEPNVPFDVIPIQQYFMNNSQSYLTEREKMILTNE